MTRTMLTKLAVPALAALALTAAVTSGCSSSAEDGYRAEIRRTSYGIPHIKADSIASLGFGEGYALAEDHMCSLADVVVRARGERAKYFGKGEGDRHLHGDITMKALRMHERAAQELAEMEGDILGWTEGYVAGVNLYLEETGVDNVPGWCQGADWVQAISATDLIAYQRSVTTIMANFAAMISTAQPPSATSEGTTEVASNASTSAEHLESVDWANVLDTIKGDQASNGWGIGKDLTVHGGGMLVANPHYPWLGSNRFWEKHLTLTDDSDDGELDIYGAGLIGIQGVAIGFNRAVGWTHTVSAGKRYTAYTLTLNPENVTQYRYDDEWRDLEARSVTVEVANDAGEVAPVSHTVWMSHYGPVVNFPGVGWSPQMVLAIKDANDENEESRPQWLAMDRAKSLEEFQEAHQKWGGLPWVNTVSAAADGRAWYIDSSSTPNLSEEALAAWQASTESNPLAQSFWQRGIVVLDGSNSMFEWQEADGARDAGVASYDQHPKTTRTDYIYNANDSYWLNNSNALLTGYSPLMGGEGTPRTLRTRMNDIMLNDSSEDGPAGADGKYTLQEMAASILSNRSLAADLLRDELVLRCRRQPRFQLGATRVSTGITVDLSQACDVLANWDGLYEIESQGAVLFREWITQYSVADTVNAGDLFAVAFDPENPIDGPNTLTKSALAMERLAKAVVLLKEHGHALDVPLGDVQYANRGGKRIPIHGGGGTYEGIANFVRNGGNGTTLEPMIDPRPMEGSRTLTEDGYPVNSGTSFIMALEYQADGTPNAQAFLTYGQSGDPNSEHFNDQTELFSKKQWRPVLFEEAAIAADVKREYVVTGG